MRSLADWVWAQGRAFMARIQGYEVGVVRDVEDPMMMGRIRVKFPWHDPEDDKALSDWIPPAHAFRGDEYGETFSIPQVGDVVLCIFYRGDIRFPAYMGTLWIRGGKAPRLDFKKSKPIIKGYPTSPNEEWKPDTAPDLSPKNYPEPPQGAWITNERTRRVNEWRSLGGLRILLEEFKRRLRIWTHPQTPFAFEVVHYDGDSVQPPRSTPYHHLRLTTPAGTTIEIIEDGANALYQTRIQDHGHTILILTDQNGNTRRIAVQHKDGHLLELAETPSQSYTQIKDKKGNIVLLDSTNGQEKIKVGDYSGNLVQLDAASGKEKITLRDKGGNQAIFDPNVPSIVMQDVNGNVVRLDPAGITLNSAQNINILAGGTVTIDGAQIRLG